MSTFSSNLADAKRNAEAMVRGLDESDLSQVSIEKEDKIIQAYVTGSEGGEKALEEPLHKLTSGGTEKERPKSPDRIPPPPGINRKLYPCYSHRRPPLVSYKNEPISCRAH